MASLVQAFPQYTGTATMLQTRPASAGGMPIAQGQPGQQHASQQRHSFYGVPNSGTAGPVVYRVSSAPIQPYAFTSTPSLNTPQLRQQQPQQQQQQMVQAGTVRSSVTGPNLPRMQSFDSASNLNRISRQPASSSMVNLSTSATVSGGRYTFGSRDDSTLPTGAATRSTASQSQPTFAQAASARASPERYRRAMPRTVASPAVPAQTQAKASVAVAGHHYAPVPSSRMTNTQTLQHLRSNSAHDAALTTVDDMQLYRQSEEAKRFRRRSMPSLDFRNAGTPQALKKPEVSPRTTDKTQRLSVGGGLAPGRTVMHNKDGSSESISSRSSASRQSSTNRSSSTTAAPTANPASSVTTASDSDTPGQSKDYSKLVSIPPRGSSDAANRAAASSPQSKPAAMDVAGADKKAAAASIPVDNPAASTAKTVKAAPSQLESPAMRHLSAINQKGGKLRSKTSRLRRAFSFGSAADFRNPPGHLDESETTPVAPVVGVSSKAVEPTSAELYDAEQDRIAQRQEEAGIGSSIYAGARIFSGSSDNLSISSTASSASIMIRKMGRGMKKGTRSLVGLFRPKSIVDVPIDEVTPTGNSSSTGPAIEATVSMVTAEAERERVNVSGDVHSRDGGGTGFPRLERNSIDAARGSLVSDRLGSSGTDNSVRKSIVGGDRERAEVLAAVRKGILKTARSPSFAPSEDLPYPPPINNDSPASSAPSTPNDEALGHKRTGSVAIGGEDYFMSALRLQQNSKGSTSGNSTPQGSMRRNATFSPRIVFHDTWPSQEYDRRGEIATCNRLTPMLAQQIKEELNSFKMEMEVHENSKIYTHFF